MCTLTWHSAGCRPCKGRQSGECVIDCSGERRFHLCGSQSESEDYFISGYHLNIHWWVGIHLWWSKEVCFCDGKACWSWPHSFFNCWRGFSNSFLLQIRQCQYHSYFGFGFCQRCLYQFTRRQTFYCSHGTIWIWNHSPSGIIASWSLYSSNTKTYI